MLNIDRVKRVLKANRGFQFPQLTGGDRFMQYGPAGLMEDGNRDWFMINNEYLKGSTIPISDTETEGTSVPNTVVDKPYQIPQLQSPQLPQSSGYSQMYQQLLDQTLGKDTTKYKYSSLANSDQLLQDTLSKNKGNFLKDLGQSVGKFINNNQGLVQGGLNILGNKLFSGTRNSKGYDIAQAGLSAFEAVPGLGLYASLGKFALGAVNKLGAKSIEDYHFNPYIYAKSGNSYSGTVNLGNKVRSLNDVEFGWFNRGEYNEAKDLRAKAVEQDYALEQVVNNADDIRAKAGDNRMYTARNIRLAGGYDPRFVGFGKQGLKLQDRINIVKSRKFNQVINVNTKQVEEFPHHVDNSSINYKAYKEGGVIQSEWVPEIELDWEPIIEIPEFQEGGKLDLQSIYDYYKDYDLTGINLMYDNSARTEGNTIYVNSNESAIHELWHLLSQNKPNERYKEFYDNLNDNRITELGGDLNFVKRFEGDPGHFYHPSELEARVKAAKYMSKGQNYTEEFFQDARSTDENKWGDNMRDLLHMFNNKNLVKIFNLKKGGTIGEELEAPETEETSQKNLIPEGALHKNKHHMEHTEGLTQKGIPVIDNDGEQQAEIELDEIIFTLEVTKKLEELYKEGTDEAAIEAGKLLVKEILFNTDDRTGLIAKCQEGGKL